MFTAKPLIEKEPANSSRTVLQEKLTGACDALQEQSVTDYLRLHLGSCWQQRKSEEAEENDFTHSVNLDITHHSLQSKNRIQRNKNKVI